LEIPLFDKRKTRRNRLPIARAYAFAVELQPRHTPMDNRMSYNEQTNKRSGQGFVDDYAVQ